VTTVFNNESSFYTPEKFCISKKNESFELSLFCCQIHVDAEVNITGTKGVFCEFHSVDSPITILNLSSLLSQPVLLTFHHHRASHQHVQRRSQKLVREMLDVLLCQLGDFLLFPHGRSNR
jgi:hypothetical protein